MGIKSDFNVPFRMSDKEVETHNKEVRNPDDAIKDKADNSEKSTGTKVLEAVAKIRGFVRIFDAIRFEPRLSSNKGAESFFDPQTIISAQRDEMKGFEKAANPINRALRKFSEAFDAQDGDKQDQAIEELKKALGISNEGQNSTSDSAQLLPEGLFIAKINKLREILKKLDSSETKEAAKKELKQAADEGEYSKSQNVISKELEDHKQKLSEEREEIKKSEVKLEELERENSNIVEFMKSYNTEIRRISGEKEKAIEAIKKMEISDQEKNGIDQLIKTQYKDEELKELKERIKNTLNVHEKGYIRILLYEHLKKDELLRFVEGNTDKLITTKDNIDKLKEEIAQRKETIKKIESDIIKLERTKADVIIYPGKSLFLRAKYGIWGTTALVVSTLQNVASLPFNLAISSRTILNHAINQYEGINNNGVTSAQRVLNFAKAGSGVFRNVVMTALLPVSAMFLKLGVITGFSDKIYSDKILNIIKEVGKSYLSPILSDQASAKIAEKARERENHRFNEIKPNSS